VFPGIVHQMVSAAPSVRLRPYTDADRWLTEAIETSDEMMAELGGPLPAADIGRVHERRLQGMAADRLWYFTVELEPEGRAVGTICLWSDVVDGVPRSEAGWATLREFQGRGLATEALRLLVERARKDGRWGNIHAFPGITNEPSNALCRNAGFTNIGEETVLYAGRQLRCNHWVLATE
jgi:RimJ/RimL family protein N-acetyltransferase